MDDTRLLLVAVFGISLLIAIQGYSLLMHGLALLNPEERQRAGGRFVYTGLALVAIATVLGLVVVILLLAGFS